MLVTFNMWECVCDPMRLHVVIWTVTWNENDVIFSHFSSYHKHKMNKYSLLKRKSRNEWRWLFHKNRGFIWHIIVNASLNIILMIIYFVLFRVNNKQIFSNADGNNIIFSYWFLIDEHTQYATMQIFNNNKIPDDNHKLYICKFVFFYFCHSVGASEKQSA